MSSYYYFSCDVLTSNSPHINVRAPRCFPPSQTMKARTAQYKLVINTGRLGIVSSVLDVGL